MARRNRDLAGLAALGALGYAMFGNKGRTDGGAPVEDRGDMLRQQAALAQAAAESEGAGDYGLEGRREGYAGVQGISAPERVRGVSAASPRMEAAEDTVSRVGAAAMSRGRRGEAYKNPQRGPSYEEISAYNRSGASPASGYAPGASTAPARPGERVPAATTSYQSTVTNPIAPGDFATEAALMFMPGPRVLRGAFRGAREAEAAAPVVRQLPGPTPRLTGPSKRSLVEEARAARAASRQEEMLRENAKRYGLDPNAPGYEGTARAVREQLGAGEFLLKKKGGMVKAKAKKMASGGSTSSASKRGDGIATKGKTKCKMY